MTPEPPQPVPGQPAGAVAELAAGYGDSYLGDLQCLRLAGVPLEDSVCCWGDDGGGALGAGAPEHFTAPVEVEGLSNAAAIFASQTSTSAVLSDGSAVVWGTAHGVLDMPAPSPQPIGFLGDNNAAIHSNDVTMDAYVLKTGGAAALRRA